ncbi:DUF3168 domain-containing protein [Propylenella binzhouense]|uniref:DUF3168 domain-containing protein n=1 Tax=Propylenella binzhouense TaxID=2555902 RepID=A0A964T8F0_9HYPH|nr:DUF3168 domain-containing protein [Propylenella binzhouense]MYZ50468.1 DUF3168 domain-containing protein [Propylenella binzhouense]
MTASPALALQAAAFAALAGDAALAGLLGGARIHDSVPRNAPAPYVHLDEAILRDWSTGSEAGAEVRFAIAVITPADGRAQAFAIAERIRALLHDAPLALDGHRLVNLRHQATETKKVRDRTLRRADLTFRAVIEPAS